MGKHRKGATRKSRMAVIPVNDEEFSVERREASPTHLLLKIESFSSLSEIGILKYESEEFAAGDYKWILVVYPGGRVSENNGSHVSAYIAMSKASSLPVGWEVHAMFSIFLYDQISDNYLCFRGEVCCFHMVKLEWGFSKLISKKSLTDPSNGYIVDDKCTFGAEVFVVKNERVMECLSVKKDAYRDKRSFEISGFFKFPDVWISEEFTAGGCKWVIMIYPNGDGNAKGQSCSIFLESRYTGEHKKVKADYCIRIKNQLTDESLSCSDSIWFTASVKNWGWPEFALIADMRDPIKGLVVKDRCVVEVEVSVQATAGSVL